MRAIPFMLPFLVFSPPSLVYNGTENNSANIIIFQPFHRPTVNFFNRTQFSVIQHELNSKTTELEVS